MARRRKSHSTTEQPDVDQEQKRKDADLADRWLKAIDKRRDQEKNWRTDQAPQVIARYRDDRGAAMSEATRFNVLWANTETLKPAIFARMPVPDIRRRYSTKDPAARTAALILERSLAYCIEAGDLEDALDRSVEDYLLPGRAVSVVRYKPTIESRRQEVPLPEGDDDSDPDYKPEYPEGTEIDDAGNGYRMVDEVIYHEVIPEYVPWDLFVFGHGKTWRRVPWIAIGCLLTESEAKAQYKHLTDEQIEAIPFTHTERESKRGEHKESGSFALFWDVWHKATRKFMVFADGYKDGPIHQQDDPLQLEHFYPVPEPMYSIRNNREWTPKPEYLQYQDQALELDEAVERLAALTSACKVRGVSDKAFDNEQAKLSDLLRLPDLTLIPIDNFRALVEKGGLKSIVDTMPLEPIVKAMNELRNRVLELKSVIDEVTGISDIVRGKTVASETLGAQQLKAQYSGLRVSKRQQRFQRYCRDIFRIKAEIIAEHFDPETLKLISGVQVLPDMLYMQRKAEQALEAGMVSESEFAQAITILRSDKLRGFKVDVETDSTIPADKEAEQKTRVEFLSASAAFMQNMMPAVQQGIIPAAVAREMLLFGVRAFKVGSELEEVLEQLGEGDDAEGMRKRLMQAQQQMQQMQQQLQQLGEENKKLKTNAEVAMEKAKTDTAVKEYHAKVDGALKEREAEQDRRIDAMNAAHDRRLKEQDAQFERRMETLSTLIATGTTNPKAAQQKRKDEQRMQQQVQQQAKALEAALAQFSAVVAKLGEGKGAQRRRVGRATLPSGGEMQFEIDDATMN